MPTVLAIETSCDETAVAILRGGELVSSEIASQIAEHREFGGVVPEVASRNHLLHLPRLLERAKSRVPLAEIDAFAATSGPGLASSLLIGSSTAKALAIAASKPFVAVNHLEGHLVSPFFGRAEIEPNVGLIVSGGHTMLVRVTDVATYEVLGRTVDDAAGEAFDKVAKLVGLGYPGGPEIERHALTGSPERFTLPRSMLDSGDLNFSFSGLKTAVRYLLPIISTKANESGAATEAARKTEWRSQKPMPGQKNDAVGAVDFAPDDTVIQDLCASFQQAVIDVLREKSLRALRQTGMQRLTISGGVSCNRALREQLARACAKNRIEFVPAEPWLCTDNAAMIALAAMMRLKRGMSSSVSEEIDPNQILTSQ